MMLDILPHVSIQLCFEMVVVAMESENRSQLNVIIVPLFLNIVST